MIWKALIGGAVGSILGPWGLAAGVALGVSWDVLWNREAPPLGARLTVRHSEDGVVIEAMLEDSIEGGLAMLIARDAEGIPLHATLPRFSGERRTFQITTTVHQDRIRCFVPYGVIATRGQQEVTLCLRVFQSPEANELDLLGEEQFPVTWPDTPYRASHFWRPMLGLCMAVARADGLVEHTEVRAVRERVAVGLRIPEEEQEIMTDILRVEPTMPLEKLLAELHLRVPRMRMVTLLTALADVAHADGTVHAAEAALIFEVARMSGVAPSQWAELSERLHLSGTDHRLHHQQLLGVSTDANAAEIEAAFTRQQARYNPERVAGMPAPFQDLARRQTEALHRARAALLQALPSEA